MCTQATTHPPYEVTLPNRGEVIPDVIKADALAAATDWKKRGETLELLSFRIHYIIEMALKQNMYLVQDVYLILTQIYISFQYFKNIGEI